MTSQTTVDFTVQIRKNWSADIDYINPETIDDSQPKVTVEWDSYQYWEFLTFLLNQLSLLMQGLMKPKVVKESLRMKAMLDRSLEP